MAWLGSGLWNGRNSSGSIASNSNITGRTAIDPGSGDARVAGSPGDVQSSKNKLGNLRGCVLDRSRRRRSSGRQHLFDDVAMYVRQAAFEPVVVVGQPFMVEAEQV